MNKKLIAVIMLVVALIVQSVPALAVDATLESVTEPTITTEPAELPEDNAEPAPTPPDDGGEGIDTPVEESPSEGQETDYTATTVEELIQAIEQAEAGATIGIGCEIVCPAGTVLGDIYKQVTLRRTAPEGRISAYSPDGTGNVIFQNIMFDGYNVEATNSFRQAFPLCIQSVVSLIAQAGPLKRKPVTNFLYYAPLKIILPSMAHISA